MCVNQKNLNRHVRSVHLKEKNFPCEDCDMTFFDTSSRRKHYNNVHKEKNYGLSKMQQRIWQPLQLSQTHQGPAHGCEKVPMYHMQPRVQRILQPKLPCG